MTKDAGVWWAPTGYSSGVAPDVDPEQRALSEHGGTCGGEVWIYEHMGASAYEVVLAVGGDSIAQIFIAFPHWPMFTVKELPSHIRWAWSLSRDIDISTQMERLIKTLATGVREEHGYDVISPDGSETAAERREIDRKIAAMRKPKAVQQ